MSVDIAFVYKKIFFLPVYCIVSIWLICSMLHSRIKIFK